MASRQSGWSIDEMWWEAHVDKDDQMYVLLDQV